MRMIENEAYIYSEEEKKEQELRARLVETLVEEGGKLYDINFDNYPTYFSLLDYGLARRALASIHKAKKRKKPFTNDLYFYKKSFKNAMVKYNYDLPLGEQAFNLVDIREAFKTSHGLNEFFPCYFFKTESGKNYRAWFHENKEGVIRYYAQSPNSAADEYLDPERIVMDAIDLYGLIFGAYDMVDDERELYKRGLAYKYVREQQRTTKDLDCLIEGERVDSILKELEKRNQQKESPEIGSTLYAVMKELLAESKKRTFQNGYFNEEGHAIFFMSINELMQRVQYEYQSNMQVKKTKIALGNALNLLAGLGFIKKYSDEELEKDEHTRTLAYNRNIYATNGRNPIQFFSINNIPSEYWVEKQIAKLTKKKINLNNVTKERFERAFGKEFTEEIFPDGYVKKKAHKYKKEMNQYTREFFFALSEKAYVTKEELSGIIPSKNVENRLWTKLVQETRGYYVKRSNQVLRKKLRTDTVGAIFVNLAIAYPFEPISVKRLSQDDVRNMAIIEDYMRMAEEALAIFGPERDYIPDITNIEMITELGDDDSDSHPLTPYLI